MVDIQLASRVLCKAFRICGGIFQYQKVWSACCEYIVFELFLIERRILNKWGINLIFQDNICKVLITLNLLFILQCSEFSLLIIEIDLLAVEALLRRLGIFGCYRKRSSRYIVFAIITTFFSQERLASFLRCPTTTKSGKDMWLWRKAGTWTVHRHESQTVSVCTFSPTTSRHSSTKSYRPSPAPRLIMRNKPEAWGPEVAEEADTDSS